MDVAAEKAKLEELPPTLIFEYIKHDYLNLKDEKQRFQKIINDNEKKKRMKLDKNDEDIEEKFLREVQEKNAYLKEVVCSFVYFC